MGMPISVEVSDNHVTEKDFELVYAYFAAVDERFSTYKPESEITKINSGEISLENFSDQMKEIFTLAEQTKKQTNGFFDIKHNGIIDPSGIVKGWAIYNAAKLLAQNGFQNFYVEAGGDIQVRGLNHQSQPWSVGIRNPFNQSEIVKSVELGNNQGMATSGNYIRGDHIYNPKDRGQLAEDIVSLTVIAENIYEADRFATAAFAMGAEGINFIESLPEFEGYSIDRNGIATFTSGFEKYSTSSKISSAAISQSAK
jgi:thiamine biosynthesis lipoprotein